MKRALRIIAFCLVGILFLGTFVFLYLNSRPKPVRYHILAVTRQDIRRITVVTGHIEPRDEVAVKPQMSGIIAEMLKQAGQYVQAGEVIARLKVIPDQAQLSSAESRLRLARLNLEQSTRDYERQRALYDKGLIAANDYERVLQAYRQAEEEAQIAQEQLELTRDGASARNAESSNTLVRSTVAGIILDIPVKVGNSVILANTFNDGTTIATVADMSDLIFRGNADETEVGRLSTGMSMDISIGALPDVHLPASIEYISPKANQTTGGANLFELKAAVMVPDTAGAMVMRSGYSATAEIVLDEARDVLTVPEAALEFVGDSTFVYVAVAEGDNPAFERRAIRTGLSDGINIEVREGLTGDERLRGGVMVEME